MAGVRISGMASGLPPDIVEQLLNAERIPLKNIENKKVGQEDLLALVNDLESKITEITTQVGELVGTRGFMDAKLISGDPSIIDGNVDPATATTGEYSFEVLELAQKPAAVSNGFPDKDVSQLGVGYIKFDTPDGEKEVYLHSSNNTLEGVAAQINAANVGLRALVITDNKNPEAPFRLMVAGLASGEGKQIDFPTVYLLDGDQDMFFEDSRPAKNARIKMDGFEFELPDNVVKDLIPGVTLDLRQAAPGREVRVRVKEDLEVISGKIKSFVDAYNGALSWIQNQHKLQKTKSGREGLGPLGGDSMLRTIESRLRRIIQAPQLDGGTSIQRIAELGIEFNRNGTLAFSEEKFNKQLTADPAGVANFLRGDGFNRGFVPTLKREIGFMLNGQFGALSQRKRGIQDKINAMNKQIDSKERQLEKREVYLRKKFSDLEATMSRLQAQGASVGALGQAIGGAKQG